MTTRTTTLELYKEYMHFSAGHFTIFSATEREHLHGHNYTVYCALDTEISENENGLSFDYRYYKKKLFALCKQLDHTFLLPTRSPYLKISENNQYYEALFDGDTLFFLKKDATLLPLTNITLEELAYWFLEGLTADHTSLMQHQVLGLTIKVFSAPGQSASARWRGEMADNC